jgi:hypothetical protein
MTTATDTRCHLNELCSECGHTNGKHGALHPHGCPTSQYGTAKLYEYDKRFSSTQHFAPSGTYCNEAQ